MIKKLSAIIMAMVLVLSLSACGKGELTPETDSTDTESTASATKVEYINPLTGENNITKEIASRRPVAVMINNFKSAQSVQTGLGSADIIYETEVEGGITRLMAVFQNVESVPLLGTVRSARYPYIDLANGHNAIYVHEGQDPTYAKPHLNDINDISLMNAGLGKRISNGLASEHTLYSEGAVLWKGIADKFDTKNDNTETWATFTEDENGVSFADCPALSVNVPFSTSYNTSFTYDEASKAYTRVLGGNVWKDYKTGESLQVKNVFVLLTTISNYPDGKHRQINLSSGDGYYITNGTYTFIKWSKGNSKDSFKFTDTDDKDLKVNIGKSYVCIADKNTSNPTIQ